MIMAATLNQKCTTHLDTCRAHMDNIVMAETSSNKQTRVDSERQRGGAVSSEPNRSEEMAAAGRRERQHEKVPTPPQGELFWMALRVLLEPALRSVEMNLFRRCNLINGVKVGFRFPSVSLCCLCWIVGGDDVCWLWISNNGSSAWSLRLTPAWKENTCSCGWTAWSGAICWWAAELTADWANGNIGVVGGKVGPKKKTTKAPATEEVDHICCCTTSRKKFLLSISSRRSPWFWPRRGPPHPAEGRE